MGDPSSAEGRGSDSAPAPADGEACSSAGAGADADGEAARGTTAPARGSGACGRTARPGTRGSASGGSLDASTSAISQRPSPSQRMEYVEPGTMTLPASTPPADASVTVLSGEPRTRPTQANPLRVRSVRSQSATSDTPSTRSSTRERGVRRGSSRWLAGNAVLSTAAVLARTAAGWVARAGRPCAGPAANNRGASCGRGAADGLTPPAAIMPTTATSRVPMESGFNVRHFASIGLSLSLPD